MKKFIRQLTIFSLIFIMTFGVGFFSQKGINVQAATTRLQPQMMESSVRTAFYLPVSQIISIINVVFSPNIPDGKTGRVTATT